MVDDNVVPVSAFVVFRHGDDSGECCHDGFVLDDAHVHAAVEPMVADAVFRGDGGGVRDGHEHRGKVEEVFLALFLNDKFRCALLFFAHDFEVDAFLVEENRLGERLRVVRINYYFGCIARFRCIGTYWIAGSFLGGSLFRLLLF